MKWSLIFSTDDCSSAQIFQTDDDPQDAAIAIIQEHPYLRLMAAVEGTPRILVMDRGRTAECGLQRCQ